MIDEVFFVVIHLDSGFLGIDKAGVYLFEIEACNFVWSGLLTLEQAPVLLRNSTRIENVAL